MRNVLASFGRRHAGRRATVAIAIVFAMVIGACQAGPPSAAGLATGGPSAITASPGGSLPADASAAASSSTGPTSSSDPSPAPTVAPTPKPTPKPTPRPTATPSTSPAIASYQIPATADCGGYTDVVQIQFSWVVKRATGVTISIDGPGIFDTYLGTSGQATLPFACGAADTKHTYTLRTTGGTGPAVRWTKTVKRIG